MNHSELVEVAAKWVKLNEQTDPTLIEPQKRFKMKGTEIPDVIGWRDPGWVVVVEVKTSLNDFGRDKHKRRAERPDLGMGSRRYYLVPEFLIEPYQTPPGWGLLYVNDQGEVREVQEPQPFHRRNIMAETGLLIAHCRKAEGREPGKQPVKGKRHIPQTLHQPIREYVEEFPRSLARNIVAGVEGFQHMRGTNPKKIDVLIEATISGEIEGVAVLPNTNPAEFYPMETS